MLGGEEGHRYFKCPNANRKVGDRRVFVVDENVDVVNGSKVEDNLWVQRVFLGKRTLEPCQKRNLFKTPFEYRGNYWNVIVDYGSAIT